VDVRSHKITPEMFDSIVYAVGLDYSYNLDPVNTKSLYADGTGVRGRVRAKVGAVGQHDLGAGARRSGSSRRSPAACWHAYRDVLVGIFDADPDAVVVTALARYNGREGFQQTYRGTAHYNVGSRMYPESISTLCDCA